MRLPFIVTIVATFVVAGLPVALQGPSGGAAAMSSVPGHLAASHIATQAALQDSTSGASGDSKIEGLLGVAYQNDGGMHGDAPGTCKSVDPNRKLVVHARSVSGMLVQKDDEADAYQLPLGTDLVGARLQFNLTTAPGGSLYTFGYDIVDASCGVSVFDPNAPMYHPETNAPAQPFQPSPGQQTYDLGFNDPYGCADSWRFLVKHTSGATPSSLYVQWSNGDYTYIRHDPKDPSEVAKYDTAFNVKNTISRIAVQMPIGWSGTLSIAHGPCGVQDFQVAPPTKEAGTGTFTLVESGNYVLLITMKQGPLDKLGAGPKRCHEAGCVAIYDESGYGLAIDTVNVA